jgi:SagB-type dehydrogenase family enzyme
VTTVVRRSAALVLGYEGSAVFGGNILVGRRTWLSSIAIGLLAALADWRASEELFAPSLSPEEREVIAAELGRLIEEGLVVVAGSPVAEIDLRYEREWKWGLAAGLYHFGIKDPAYLGPAEMFAVLNAHAATTPSPPLYATNDGLPRTPLAPPPDDGLIAVMARRRSTRAFDPEKPLPLEALRDCLYSALAIVGFGKSGVPGEGYLPFKATPSGGARNPFEAYVVARSVEGLAAGVYHYAGIDHSLGLVRPGPAPALDGLLGGQAWFAGAGAVIFLVADFARCWWKYPHPTGFRVVLLEAGHIAQNLLVAAAVHGLAATPTCALSDRAVEELLGLDRVTQAAVHSVALGARAPGPSPADLPDIQPNPLLPR